MVIVSVPVNCPPCAENCGNSILHRLVILTERLDGIRTRYQVPFPFPLFNNQKIHYIESFDCGCKASKALVHPPITDRGIGRLKIPGQLSGEIVLIARSHGQEWLDMIPRFLRQQCALHFQVLRQNIETDRGGGIQSSP